MLGPEAQARAIEELLLRGKYKKIALIWNQSDGPKSVHDAIIKVLSADSAYTVVADESVTKGENDFKTSIAKIKAAKPEVVMAYISPQVGIFAKQAKDLKLNVPFVGGPPFEIMDQIIAAQGGLDNQLFVANDNVAYTDAFYKKYDIYPTIAGDYAYDAVSQLIEAVNVDNSKASIIKFLRGDFKGVSGIYENNGDGSFDVVQVVKKWNGEKFVVVK
ncbi:MAG: ABC transporter substrate-binding protein [Candidatus Taylorbacteria bacterium]|nr:ABC transporter substrate-binding protein [Candidatus Taylorbacteria bacterium]